MLFGRPEFLWLLSVALLQLPLALRSQRLRRWAAAGLRACCAAAVVLALAEPSVMVRPTASGSIVVVDVGPGMPSDLPVKDSHVVAFSNRAEVIDDRAELQNPQRRAALQRRLNQPLWPDDLPTGGSNLAAALQLAGAECDRTGIRQLDLITNGLTTRGDAAAEAYRLARKGISINVRPVGILPASHTVVIRRETIPARTRVGETVPLRLTVESTRPQHVTLTTRIDDRTIETPRDVAAGLSDINLPVSIAHAGTNVFQTWLGTDAPLQAATFAEPASRVLVVHSGGSTAFSDLLQHSANLSAITPAELSPASLSNTDALVLDDVPADQLSPQVQRAVEAATGNGMGLLVTGASRSFGPGGYADSALAPLLPVKLDRKIDRVEPSVALVLIIDSSGSMEGEKLDLAKDVARLAISHLRPADKVGLVEFYGGKRWAAPIQSAANLAVINRALARLTAGGGTTLYPAVEEADFALHNVSAQRKNVVIISDGFVENSPFAERVRSMADDGVAVSTVAVKADPHERNLMPAIAMWGRGRYYTVPDRFAVPDITLNQPTLLPQPELVQTPSRISAGNDPLLREIGTSDWGNIDGYARTTAKASADVLLHTADHSPLLARWHYGAGLVAVFTSQLNSAFTANLQSRPAFAQLLAGVIRYISGVDRGGARFTPIIRDAGVELDIVANTAQSDVNQLHLAITDSHNALVRTVDAVPIAPGHWNVLVTGLSTGVYQCTSSLATSAFALNGPREVRALSPNASLLAQLQSFQSLTVQNQTNALAQRSINLTRPLILLAIGLLLLHVAVRRLPS